MANPKKTSLAALKAALREGKKYAKEANGIEEDPNKVSVPAENNENVLNQADYNIPTDNVENTDNMSEARVLDNGTTPETLTADEKDPQVNPEKKPAVVEEESEVTLKGASAVKKLQEAISKMKSKTANSAPKENVASNIDLSQETLNKVAKVMLATERGKSLALQALEQEQAEQMKYATLRELLTANEEFEAQKALTKTAAEKYASIHNVAFGELKSALNADGEFEEMLKRAYAQGAEDAAAAAEQGALPAEEAAPAAPEAQQDEVMQIIGQLVQAGLINEQQAEGLAQLAAQAAQSDGDPALSEEEMMAALQAAEQQGLIPAGTLEQMMGGGAAPAPAAGAPTPEQPADVAASAAAPVESPTPAEASAPVEKTARVVALAQKVASIAMFRKNIAEQVKKAAEGEAVEDGVEPAPEDVDVSPEDLANVLAEAVASGEISPDEAQEVEAVLVEALNGEEGVPAEDQPAVEDGDEIDAEQLAEILAEEGVSPEELQAAIAEIEAEEGAEGAGEVAE